jgi:hyperosmotically inducible periplasmic protein
MRKIAGLLLVSSLCLAMGCSESGKTNNETTPPAASSTPSNPPDADNTARNADTSTLAETPTAQSENATDLQISAAIRKSVVDDKSLSVNAHNVKIITSGGVVTLRGPVKNDDERKTIEAKAKQVAGVTQVNNLLEVERNP